MFTFWIAAVIYTIISHTKKRYVWICLFADKIAIKFTRMILINRTAKWILSLFLSRSFALEFWIMSRESYETGAISMISKRFNLLWRKRDAINWNVHQSHPNDVWTSVIRYSFHKEHIAELQIIMKVLKYLSITRLKWKRRNLKWKQRMCHVVQSQCQRKRDSIIIL